MNQKQRKAKRKLRALRRRSDAAIARLLAKLRAIDVAERERHYRRMEAGLLEVLLTFAEEP